MPRHQEDAFTGGDDHDFDNISNDVDEDDTGGDDFKDDKSHTGGVCTFNTTTGIPDENCYFVPNLDANVSR